MSDAAWAAVSALAASISAAFALQSYRLHRQIRREAQSDDRLIFGIPSEPALAVRPHRHCVIQCQIFNKSKRKAFITAVNVYDGHEAPIAVTWSGEIDGLGNPLNASGHLGIVDQATLYIRRDDGERFEYAKILLQDSFSEARAKIVFDPVASFR